METILGGTEEKISSPIRGDWFALQAYHDFLPKGNREKRPDLQKIVHLEPPESPKKQQIKIRLLVKYTKWNLTYSTWGTPDGVLVSHLFQTQSTWRWGLGPLKTAVSAQNALKGFETQMRELLEETEENNILLSPERKVDPEAAAELVLS